MCGISGFISGTPLGEQSIERLRGMLCAQINRGPDGQGEYVSHDARAMFGMRRLAIIDLTGGWQPLYNEDQSIALVANGEVYNFVELRKELESLGHRFHTKSDCECIAHAYEQWGDEFVHKLRGMYAFCVYDRTRNRVLLGRDRVGEKPMYLFESPGQLLFASELKGLLASGLVPFELDAVGVNEFFHYGWIPEPRTAVAGVRKLPPATLMTIELNGWKVREHRYWRLEDSPPIEGNPVNVIRDELDTIAELIVRSDVPVGVALSAGIDSSAVAALAHSKYPGTMHAFSVGFKDRPPQDERREAKQFADALKMPFHEVEVDAEEIAEFFEELCYLRDDPIGDLAGHGIYAVNKASRASGCPVLLMGQGGDELFWGYPWARRALAESRIKDATGTPSRSGWRELIPPGMARPQMVAAAYKLGGVMHGWGRLSPNRHAPAEQLIAYDLTTSYQMGEYGTPRVLTDDFLRRVEGHHAGEFFTVKRPWGRVDVLLTKLQIEGYLLENGIQQGDRLSMANSVELRLPLVDYRLIELVVGLRKANPDDALSPKQWLKSAVRHLVPDFVFNRPKRGFNLPGTVSNNAIRERWGSCLENGFLSTHGILRPSMVAKLNREHSRLAAWNDLASKAITLELWARRMSALASSARQTLSTSSKG